ncbi:DJ-1/PfpI family protein [Campylobacter sp. faydin G-140]|uniref:DJ-1 family glyoxalase III n=1 Tax=Campylobacter anatolicus TaxID=2829105 RepID=UPI001B957AFF|nr:DJ-1 family glyoxalase III [Campylobacter anatolicus]MBR8465622.1 DJ-1/PfpI family protein [Campylobacter anatolicus]
MKKVAVMFANGFEEIEAITIVDVLRRADIDVFIVGLDREIVVGVHGISVKVDMLLNQLNTDEFDMIVLPGGLPGATNLAQSKELCEVLRRFDNDGKLIGAICAAPMALGVAGVLKDSFTCYPGFEMNVRADKTGFVGDKNVVSDQNIITSAGPATSMIFALEIVKELCGIGTYENLKNELLYNRL